MMLDFRENHKTDHMIELPLDPNVAANSERGDAAEPVRYLPSDSEKKVERGTALCLSGGGYRAMLFHTGVLWRLNELESLVELKRISSVSGGSITAGVLGTRWR